MRFAHLFDQRGHRGVRLQQFREYRKQPVAHLADPALGESEIEHSEEFSVRAGIGDERGAAGIGHRNRLRHRVMGVAAENDVDAADPAGELQIDIHAVMRQQHHGVDLVAVAQAGHQVLQFGIADPKRPVRRKPLWVSDRHIGKSLPDHGDAMTADFLDGGRLEHAAGRGIESLGVVECGFLGQEDVLGQKFALEALEVAAQRLLAIGEFPVAGHRLDAEQICGLDHVGALHGIGLPGALP